MIYASFLLLFAQQSLTASEPIQRELRMHSVTGLISNPVSQLLVAHQWNLLTHFVVPSNQELLPDLTNLSDRFGATRDVSKFESVKEIEELATRFCQPPLDPKQERIQADDQGWLVCYLRPEQHEWLEQFLNLQRADERQWMADIETRWYTIPSAGVASLKLESSAVLLDDEQAIASMRKTLSRISAEEVAAPRVTAFPGQRAEISVLNDLAYVKEYKLEIVEPGRKEIADPVVDVIQEGLVMDLRALQTGDELYGLRLSCASSEVERPIPTRRFKLTPASGTEVEIAMPQVRTAKVDATVLVADGGGVLLITSGLSADRNLAILVTFRRTAVTAETEER